MGWLDLLMRKKHPSDAWQADAGFSIELDLDRHALGGCTIGDPIEWLSGLGPPEDRNSLREQRYRYFSKGFEIGTERDQVADFAVFWIDYLEQGFQSFTGTVIFRGKSVSLGSQTTERDFLARFGSPYWRDQDEDEIILFYEFPGDIEWQVEFTVPGLLKAMWVVWPPLLAEPEQREIYGVTRPWPPTRESKGQENLLIESYELLIRIGRAT